MDMAWSPNSVRTGDRVTLTGGYTASHDPSSITLSVQVFDANDIGPDGKPNDQATPLAQLSASDDESGFTARWSTPGAGSFVAYAILSDQSQSGTSPTLTVSDAPAPQPKPQPKAQPQTPPPPAAAPAPSVTGIDPQSGDAAGGTAVTISGSNLGNVSDVTLGGVSLIGVSSSDTEITGTTGAHAAGAVDLVLSGDPSGDVTVSGGFNYTASSSQPDPQPQPNPQPDPRPQTQPTGAPNVTGIDPPSGDAAGGTTVTISGSNLGNVSDVTLGGVALIGVSASDTQITGTTGAHDAGAVDLVLTGDPSGDVTVAGGFNYTASSPSPQPAPQPQPQPAAGPNVIGIDPLTGDVAGGTNVTISGSGLGNISSITFGGVELTGVTASDAQMTGTTGAHAAGSVDVVLSGDPTGDITLSGGWTYTAAAPSNDDEIADKTYYYPPDEKATFDYQISVIPNPPSDTAVVNYHKGSETGDVGGTDTLQPMGNGTLQVDLSSYVANTDSPIFCEFLVTKSGNQKRSVRAISLAEAQPGAFTITPPAANVGDNVQLEVSSWAAAVYDTQGMATNQTEADPTRITDAIKQTVHWNVDGTDLPDTGPAVSFTATADQAGRTLQIIAYIRLAELGAQGLVAVTAPPLSVQSLTLPTAPDGKCYVAPGAETVPISYQVTDVAHSANAGKLSLLTADGTVVSERALNPNEIADGSHMIPFDGTLFGGDKPADYPDGYVTALHSPYTIRVTVSNTPPAGAPAGGTPDPGSSDQKTVDFLVVMTGLKVDLGDKAALVVARDKGLYDTVKAAGPLPVGAAIRRIALSSNLYYTNFNTEVSSPPNALVAPFPFTTFRDDASAGWGDGPNIPIAATIKFKKSDGTETPAGKGWGKMRVLWDWAEPAKDLSSLDATPRAFVTTARGYQSAATTPPGDNCHTKFGGKRGSATRILPVLPNAAITTLTNTAVAATTRTWALLSGPDATTGLSTIIFQPSRMAGDTYKIRVYFGDPAQLDVAPPTAPTPLAPAPETPTLVYTVELGTFEMTRSLDVIRTVQKKAAVPSFVFGTFQTYFNPVRMFFNQGYASVDNMTKAFFDTQYATAYPAVVTDAWWQGIYVDPAVAQYDATTATMQFRPYADMQTAAVAKKKSEILGGAPAASPAADAAATTQAQNWVKAQLQSAGLQDAAHPNVATKYENFANNDVGLTVGKTLANNYFLQAAIAAADSGKFGIYLSQFEGFSNFSGYDGEGYGGAAFGDARHRSAFILGATTDARVPNYKEQVLAHEIGHLVFLAHAPVDVAGVAAEHDASDLGMTTGCTMGYGEPAPHFCGFCLLTLQGWDKSHLNNDGTFKA